VRELKGIVTLEDVLSLYGVAEKEVRK